MFQVPLLAKIPIRQSIRESGDRGVPCAAESGSADRAIFDALALKVQDILDKNRNPVAQLKIVN
jgi:hypothetical protein